MVPPIVEELKRLERGILTYHAKNEEVVVLCGSITHGTGDNPAASDLSSHSWRSDFPCRLCLFNKKQCEISDVSTMRVLSQTTSATDVESCGMRAPLTEFYDLPGLNPHFDWVYDVLHGAQLGYIKYLWQETLENVDLKKDLDDIAKAIDAANLDGFKKALSGRRIVRWNGSFNGGDFKTLIQLMPTILLDSTLTRRNVSENLKSQP